MLQNVVLEENTTGRDGQEYVLHCSVESPALQRLGGPALTYDIPFLFYNGRHIYSFQSQFVLPDHNEYSVPFTMLIYFIVQSFILCTKLLLYTLQHSVNYCLYNCVVLFSLKHSYFCLNKYSPYHQHNGQSIYSLPQPGIILYLQLFDSLQRHV